MDFSTASTYCSNGIDIAKKTSQLLDNGSPDSQFMGFAHQLEVLKARFATQELLILVAGEVSSGKSTFINTLIGTDCLSVARETCTNVPTKISYGKEELYIVHFAAGSNSEHRSSLKIKKDEVQKYTSESGNPKNKLGVAFVEIKLDSPLLSKGLSFIDTPGLGAIDPLHAIATYNIAAQADIIFFLGDSSKPLTSVEIVSLKNLIKVSEADYVAHLLTRADENDPKTILEENKQIISREFGEKKIDYFMISSNKYIDYISSDDKYDQEDSGFIEVESYIEHINSNLSAILIERFRELILHVCQNILSELKSLFESVENPEAQEARRDKLKAINTRLEEITKEWPTWNLQLKERQQMLDTEIRKFITSSRHSIGSHVEEMLKDSSYLEDKNKLVQSITADLVKFQHDLDTKMKEDYVNIYEWLRETTGLSKIQEKIGSPNFVPTKLHIDKNVGNIHTGHKIRNIWISTSTGVVLTAAGYKVGAIAGFKIGAAIGTTIAPGIGTAIGGAVGALAGAASGVAIYLGFKKEEKDKKRREIQSECEKQIALYFTNINNNVTAANIPNSTDLSIEFQNQLRNEKETCQARLNRIADLALRLRANYDGVKDLTKRSKELVKNLSES